MTILVCGGRDYADDEMIDLVLRQFYWADGGTIVQGGAKTVDPQTGETLGADYLAWCWALDHGVKTKTYLAKWRELGRAAGPIRNQQMLDEGKPDLVVAFPGGRGTADMVRRARAAGVPVLQVLP